MEHKNFVDQRNPKAVPEREIAVEQLSCINIVNRKALETDK